MPCFIFQADVLIEVPPAGFDPSDLSENLSLPSRMTNGQSFEEGVTSFGRSVSSVDTSSSLNGASLQCETFTTVATVSHEFSHDDAVTVHAASQTSQDSQSQLTLLTFKENPQDHGHFVPDNESHTSKSDSGVITWTHLDGPGYSQALSSLSASTLEHDQSERSDNTGSTSSLSANEASERQALLGDRQSRLEESPARFSALNSGIISGAKMNDGMDGESDDTDSMGTPHGSPAKSKQVNRNPSIDLGMLILYIKTHDIP